MTKSSVAPKAFRTLKDKFRMTFSYLHVLMLIKRSNHFCLILPSIFVSDASWRQLKMFCSARLAERCSSSWFKFSLNRLLTPSIMQFSLKCVLCLFFITAQVVIILIIPDQIFSQHSVFYVMTPVRTHNWTYFS